MVRQNIMNLVL